MARLRRGVLTCLTIVYSHTLCAQESSKAAVAELWSKLRNVLATITVTEKAP
jgi:hypothetical protein